MSERAKSICRRIIWALRAFAMLSILGGVALLLSHDQGWHDVAPNFWFYGVIVYAIAEALLDVIDPRPLRPLP